MKITVFIVIGSSDDGFTSNQHGTNHGVDPRPSPALLRELQAFADERVMVHGTSIQRSTRILRVVERPSSAVPRNSKG